MRAAAPVHGSRGDGLWPWMDSGPEVASIADSAPEGDAMTTVKVIEVLAQSPKSWEDAAQQALDQAKKSVRNIQSIYIKSLQADVEDDKIKNYRINAKISFLLD
jgi:dodecin